MKKILLVILFAFSGYCLAGNDCRIESIDAKEESNSFTFKTILQKNLNVYTPQPKKALLAYDGVTYIYDEDNLIGFITVREKFKKSETIEKTLKEFYFYDCSQPILKISKSNFDIFIIKNNLNDKPRATAFILDKNDDSYFYLLSFVGFSKNQATQMLIRK